MDHQPLEAFPPEIIETLKTYVYRLIDPRNGKTFYVGKGTDNRVFAHIRAMGDVARVAVLVDRLLFSSLKRTSW